MKTTTAPHRPASQNGRHVASKTPHPRPPRRRSIPPTTIAKKQAAAIKVAGLIDRHGDFINLAASRPENLRFLGEVEKTVTITFDEPGRWRLCYAKFADHPEWRPTHVLDMPPTLRGATDEIFGEQLPFVESREAALQAWAEHNAGQATHGSSAPDDRRWAFAIEFGHTPKTTISLLTEFTTDAIGVEEFTTRRVVRVVAPTATERAAFDALEVAGDLPVTGGDPAHFRVYGVPLAKHHFRKWLGDFETAAEAREAAAEFKAERAGRADDNLAFIVVPPGPLPSIDELRRMATKAAPAG